MPEIPGQPPWIAKHRKAEEVDHAEYCIHDAEDWPCNIVSAFRAGYAEAVAYLRDDERYLNWWSSSDCVPDGTARQHLADYLETVGPDGPDVTSAARGEG